MTESKRDTQPSVQDVALIVGGGPGISSSCARLFAENGMRVCVAARNPEKAVLETLEKTLGVHRYACDASDPAAVAQLFGSVVQDVGTPRLVVHNIDGRVPKRTDAARYPHRECADRRRDRLDSGRRDPRAPAGGNNCRRQHGRPRPYRENLSSASSAASVDLGVRSRAPAMGREMVTRTCFGPDLRSAIDHCLSS
jgi:Enoyl-(Acyl carrier protein) reductase